jgi:putative DNA primase/helicase
MRHCRDDVATLPEPEWYRLLTVLARCEDAERWAHALSAKYPRYSKRETQRKLQQASSAKVAPVTCAYVASELNGEHFCAECLFRGNVNSPIAIGRIENKEAAPKTLHALADTTESAPSAATSEPAVIAAAARIEQHTDLGNAKRFVARYRGSIVYCAVWKTWYLWDDKRWQADEKLAVFVKAADLIRGLYPRAMQIKDPEQQKALLSHLRSSESERALNAMLSLAKSDSALARHPDDFDTDPWLLNVANGTVNLCTGQLQPHDPRNLISRLAPVVYDPAATCPNWLDFLNMIMDGCTRLISFLQRAFGLSLTGITSEKAMYILYGSGGDNGKSTMIDVMQRILGDYARRTPVETFLRKREGSIPNDVARLKGARFVWAAENERGSRLSESLIKEMTGGDKMVARFMRGEFFEFMPAFKLWLATNHRPAVRGDKAVWRRLKLVPFMVSIPVAQQKPRHEVMEMFAAEHSGILNWALEGCLDWQRNGLGVPEEVVEATREYEAEQDTFATFLYEECIRAPNARAASIALYHAYRRWAEDRGEFPLSHKNFASLMSEHGYQKGRTAAGIVYFGVGLLAKAHSDASAQPVQPRRFVHGEEEGEEV